MSAFFDSISPNTEGSHTIAPLSDYAVIAASGDDALAFLHGQLTQDVTGLSPDAARLAGYCTAKGRLLATMVMWLAQATPGGEAQPTDPRLYALVRRDLSEALVKRLSMFVLRAKAKLTLTPLHVAGVWTMAGNEASLEAAAGGALPTSPWQRAELPTGTWIAAPSVTGPRWWWIATDEQLQQAAALASLCRLGDADAWQAGDLAAGLPWVCAATQDLFIPQTLNLDLIEGVNFTKGCYPGQEVVARSHYRGTVKRRTAYGQLDSSTQAPAPGTDIYDAQHPDEPRGRIVNAARGGALFEIALAALDGGDLRVGAADGAKLSVAPLPYDLADGGHKR
ncbi:folate-binding protein YgfZ [Bordetella sp. 15P40C-2]|uniref:CAF17-like 4Fe-4S cluster assembly/insertion protein YgfZ n=1 Tax=Bordetella sp. 15P40C-2 TaxID=2572246 RepID=UPI001329B216|nr:folate-binding protein YgfZ [Bordetella sp. 15P40C-2]MVW73164.1 folate-binding protein [Bordetella sp. 15P40C-2]